MSTVGLMRLMGAPLPTTQFPVLAAPVMFLAFFITALGEELGWSGYVTDPMQDRWNALFPNCGSHYDPRITGLVVAFAATTVAVVWGPQTLARYRNS